MGDFNSAFPMSSPSSIYDPSCSDPLALAPSLCILEGESICDLAWFPSMNNEDPSTCCFLSSVRDHPVRLWDATTGKVNRANRNGRNPCH